MRRQLNNMMHEMEEQEWELADEILRESQRRQTVGRREEGKDYSAYKDDVKEALIKHSQKMEAQQRANEIKRKSFEIQGDDEGVTPLLKR